MKRWFMVFVVALSMVILLSPCIPQAASPTASTTTKATTSSVTAAQPQTGGILKVIVKSRFDNFGYPPRIVGSDRDYAPPFFDHLLSIGDDGKYQPELALGWDASTDGKPSRLSSDKALNSMTVRPSMPRLLNPTLTILFLPTRRSSVASLPSMSLMITRSSSISLLITTSFFIISLLTSPPTCILRRR